jgi:hypothetical protein
LGVLLFLAAIFILPGGLAYNAAFDNVRFLYGLDKALSRVLKAGPVYLKAWFIVVALLISLSGILLFGVGFFFLSYWAWEVAGYVFIHAVVSWNSTQELTPSCTR